MTDVFFSPGCFKDPVFFGGNMGDYFSTENGSTWKFLCIYKYVYMYICINVFMYICMYICIIKIYGDLQDKFGYQ